MGIRLELDTARKYPNSFYITLTGGIYGLLTAFVNVSEGFLHKGVFLSSLTWVQPVVSFHLALAVTGLAASIRSSERERDVVIIMMLLFFGFYRIAAHSFPVLGGVTFLTFGVLYAAFALHVRVTHLKYLLLILAASGVVLYIIVPGHTFLTPLEYNLVFFHIRIILLVGVVIVLFWFIAVDTYVYWERLVRKLMVKIHQSNHFTTIGRNAGSITHNLKNSLSTLETGLTVLEHVVREHDLSEEAEKQILSRIRGLNERARSGIETIEPLLFLSGVSNRVQKEYIDLSRLLRSIVADMKLYFYDGRPYDVTVQCRPGVWYYACGGELLHLFENLIKNSFEAVSRQSGTRSISIRLMVHADSCEVAIQDNGRGIEQCAQTECRKKNCLYCPVFDIGKTSKTDGHGLGIFFVRDWLKRNDGDFIISSYPEAGSLFRVILPGEVVTGSRF